MLGGEDAWVLSLVWSRRGQRWLDTGALLRCFVLHAAITTLHVARCTCHVACCTLNATRSLRNGNIMLYFSLRLNRALFTQSCEHPVARYVIPSWAPPSRLHE